VGRGRLISFEGLDGSGKTTQLDMLERWLSTQHISYIRTREPGGTSLGVEIRQLLLNRPELAITPLAETFLFQADRAQHFAQLILPALARGTLVITDRCFDSSIAYQGVGRGVGATLVEQLSLLATQGYQPDLTILFDLDPVQARVRTDVAQRTDGSGEQQSRFDVEAEQFHHTVRQAFLDLASNHPARIKVLDASQSPEVVHQEIIALVGQLVL